MLATAPRSASVAASFAAKRWLVPPWIIAAARRDDAVKPGPLGALGRFTRAGCCHPDIGPGRVLRLGRQTGRSRPGESGKEKEKAWISGHGSHEAIPLNENIGPAKSRFPPT